MTPEAAPAHPPAPLSWGQWLSRVFGWMLLAYFFISPPFEAMNWELDSSNYGTYAWMVTQGKQFGGDVVPMTGPYGFLFYGTTYAGYLFTARLVGDLLLKMALAFFMVRFAVLARNWAGWFCLGLILVCAPNVQELPYDLGILFAGCNLLLAPGARPRLPDLLAAALIGFLALLKGTQLSLAVATLGAVGLRSVLERKPAWVIGATAAATVSFLGFWLAAGQQIENLPGYVRGILALVKGYNETMGLDEDYLTFVVGLTIAGGMLLALGLSGVWRERARWPVFLFLAGFLFVKWKHGFVRADGHVFLFYYFCVIGLGVLWALRPPVASGAAANAPRSEKARRTAYAALGVPLLGLTLFAACEFWDQRFLAIFRHVLPYHWHANFRYIARPAEVRASLEEKLAQNRIAGDLPQVRNEVGSGTIDFFGFEQGLLLLNGLNYHPRPMGGGSFNVYHPYLQRLNEEFIRSPQHRPAFQLMRLRTIDDRLPTGDDPLTLNALLHLYSPVLIQRDYLLFRARTGVEAPVPLRLARHAVLPGEPIPVPDPGPDKIVLFSINAPPSVAGWLRAALYRPANLEAVLETDGSPRQRRFRVLPLMLKAPAILSPLLVDNNDVVRLYGPDQGCTVRTLTLVPQDADWFDAESMRVTFYSMPRPPPPPDTDVQEIVTYMKYPLHNRTPLRLRTEETGIRELNKEPITLVHAPGTIAYPLEADDQQVIFSYGIMPQAYDPGQTDGVEFLVEVVAPDGRVAALFRRLLQPLTFPEHRGMQRARVFLPAQIMPGSELRIRTSPGPAGNGAWDQSYVTRLQIKKGGVDPRRYFGFNLEPEQPAWDEKNEFALEGRPVRSVHPPFNVTFRLPAGARRVVLGFGLMPGAYTGEGSTDGVDFVLQAVLPDQSRIALWQRRLDPRAHASDRGIVGAEVVLPALPAGTRLEFATTSGPQGNTAWDWAVLQTLFVE